MMSEQRESGADRRRGEKKRAASLVLLCFLMSSSFSPRRGRKNLGERRHSQLYQPRYPTSLFPLRLSRSLPLSAGPNHCLYSCLSPLQQKPFSGESHAHTITHAVFPGSDVVQEVMILVRCRLVCSGNIYFLENISALQ